MFRCQSGYHVSQAGLFLRSNSPDVDSGDRRSSDVSLGHSVASEIVVIVEGLEGKRC